MKEKIHKVICRVGAILLVLGMIWAIGVIGEQDREYFVASHQPYRPKSQFIYPRRFYDEN